MQMILSGLPIGGRNLTLAIGTSGFLPLASFFASARPRPAMAAFRSGNFLPSLAPQSTTPPSTTTPQVGLLLRRKETSFMGR